MKLSAVHAFLAAFLFSAALVAADQRFFYHNEVTGVTQWEKPTAEHYDDSGNVYYVDPKTGESTWEKPAFYAWEAQHSEDHGQEYYWNTVTQETVWEKPEYLAWKVVPVKDEL